MSSHINCDDIKNIYNLKLDNEEYDNYDDITDYMGSTGYILVNYNEKKLLKINDCIAYTFEFDQLETNCGPWFPDIFNDRLRYAKKETTGFFTDSKNVYYGVDSESFYLNDGSNWYKLNYENKEEPYFMKLEGESQETLRNVL